MITSRSRSLRRFEPTGTTFWARTDLAGTPDVAVLDQAESQSRIVLTIDKDFWHIAVQRRSPLHQSGAFCSEFILQFPRISHLWYVRSSRQTRGGLDTSESSRVMEFKWWRRAESEARFSGRRATSLAPHAGPL